MKLTSVKNDIIRKDENMKLLLISIVLCTTGFMFFLKYLNYTRRNAPVPKNVSDVYDEETYQKQMAYKMDNLKISIISGLVGLCLTLAYLIFNFHHVIYTFADTENIYYMCFAIFGVLYIISFVLDIVFDYYDTFVIEERHGFNKTTKKTFIVDKIKGFLINVILQFGLLSLFLLLYTKLESWVFIAFYLVLVVVTLFLTVFSHLLSKIFNKFTPLAEGELKTMIEQFAAKTGYSIKKVFVMDGSKRSKHLNAYATGMGKTKTIVLYDTLVEKMNNNEIVAVLAHEIAHAKKRHVLCLYLMNLVLFAMVMGISYFIINEPAFSVAFGFEGLNIAFSIYVLGILASPLFIILRVPISKISRTFEYSADKFAAENLDAVSMVNALKKLSRESYVNLTPHPFVVTVQHSHPPIHQRIEALGSNFEPLPFPEKIEN